MLVETQSFDIVVVLRDELATKQNIGYFLNEFFLNNTKTLLFDNDPAPVNASGYRFRYLFAFSGHGVFSQRSSSKLVLWNGTGEDGDRNTLPLKELDTSLETIKAKAFHVLVLINSCYSGDYFNHVPAHRDGGGDANFRERGSWAVTSGSDSDPSYEDPLPEAKGSIFFDGVIQAVKKLDGAYPPPQSGRSPDILKLQGIVKSVDDFIDVLNFNGNLKPKLKYVWAGGIDEKRRALGSFFFLVPQERKNELEAAKRTGKCVDQKVSDTGCEPVRNLAADFSVSGVDASPKLNPDIDWDYLVGSKRFAFAYLRGTVGVSNLSNVQTANDNVRMRLQRVLDAGAANENFKFGLYHVFTYCDPPSAQIESVAKLLSGLRLRPSLPLAVDFEYFPNSVVPPGVQSILGQCKERPQMSEVQGRLKTFLAMATKRFGKMPVLYLSISALSDKEFFDNKLRQYPLWIADYSTAAVANGAPRTNNWTFWQYGEQPIPGTNSKVDRNVFHGSAQDFADFVR